MAKKGTINDLNGMFLYHDPKHGTIFYDIFTKRAFALTTSDTKQYLTYVAMLPVSIIVALGLIAFVKMNYVAAICIALAIIIASEIYFRVAFFYKLPEVKNWKPIKKESLLVSFAKKYSPQRLIVLAILLVAVAACTIIYQKMEELPQYAYIAGYILSAGCVIAAVLSLVALIIKKNNNY